MRKLWMVAGALSVGIVMGVVGWIALSHVRDHAMTVATMPLDRAVDAQKTLYTCVMHPQVIEDHPGDCPICHMKLVPLPSTGATKGAKGERKILYWWDPMLGSSSIADKPGKSAMGMDRVPVYADDASAGPTVTVDPAVAQNMGVRTAVARRGPLMIAVRAVGMLKVPEPGMRDISLKVSGWIDTLQADTEGMHVNAGQALFALYGPDAVVAEDELIAAVRAAKSLDKDAPAALREQTDSLVASAKQKLRLWDIAESDIDTIAKADHAPRTVVIRSPISGHVIDKSVVTGSAVTAGTKVMRIEDHSHLWLDAEVYANDFASVAIGQTMTASIDGLPGKTFTGTISFIYPHVDHLARTLMVRATLNNADFTLRPGMYATVRVMSPPIQDALLVPRDAVIDTGSEQMAFVASGDGHFEPRRLTVGRHGDGDVEILSGLAPGESVVTSGQFLLDVESNTQSAIAKLQAGEMITDQATPTSASMSMPMSMPMTTQPVSATPSSTMLAVLHCPMKNADWLQSSDVTHNPYFGTAMSTCGSVTGHLPLSDDPLLKGTIERYLKVAGELSRDQLSGDSIAALKVATDRLDPMMAKPLRSATDTLAHAPDLTAAHVAFKPVSSDLIAFIRGGQS